MAIFDEKLIANLLWAHLEKLAKCCQTANAYLLAKFRFDTAENEPSKVCPIEPSRSHDAEPQAVLLAVPRPAEPREAPGGTDGAGDGVGRGSPGDGGRSAGDA